jgi:hypothetical protein
MSQNTEIGRAGETVYSFPRNENGMYDKEGNIPDVETKLHVKYAKEDSFFFGEASVELSNGALGGRRCETFDYSAKNLITVTTEEKVIKEEVKRVISLKTVGQWVEKR